MTKKAAIIFDRGDNDGHLSAAIVRKYFEGQSELIPYARWDLDNDVLFYIRERDFTDVFVCDIDMDPSSMQILNREYNFHWIDHHLSSIEELGPYPGLQRTDAAACELAWMYMTGGSFKDIPFGISMIGSYDMFREEREDFFDQVLPFELGVELGRRKSGDISALITASPVEYMSKQLIENGVIIREYERAGVQPALEKLLEAIEEGKTGRLSPGVFLVEHGGQSAAVMLPICRAGRQAYYARRMNIPVDIMVTYNYKGANQWTYSFRRIHPDANCLSFIQAVPGVKGGGHVGAAGGSSNSFVFE